MSQSPNFLISFKAVCELLSKKLVLKSFEGIITDCVNSFDSSIDQAKQIEDYRYLNQFVTRREDNDKKYIFFWDYKHNFPTILKRDFDLSIEALACLAFDHERSISKYFFEELVEQTAHNNGCDSGFAIEEFRSYYDSRKNLYKLIFEKIQNNDPCPCGSGEKYKKCHGKAA